jgi:rhodanese-related sulfurtransferase
VDLAGELETGMATWRTGGFAASTVYLVEPATIASTVVDVRQRDEYEAAHVPDALHVELGSLADSTTSLPDGPLTVMCGHGERAMSGASIIAAHGRSKVSVLRGGPAEWAAATGRAPE